MIATYEQVFFSSFSFVLHVYVIMSIRRTTCRSGSFSPRTRTSFFFSAKKLRGIETTLFFIVNLFRWQFYYQKKKGKISHTSTIQFREEKQVNKSIWEGFFSPNHFDCLYNQWTSNHRLRQFPMNVNVLDRLQWMDKLRFLSGFQSEMSE